MTPKRTSPRGSFRPTGARSPAPALFDTPGGEALAMLAEPLMALDWAWRFAELNARAAEGLGRPREALIGQTIWSVFPDWVGGPLYLACQQAAGDQQPAVVEAQTPGGQRWVEHRLYPSPIGLLILTLDITERKRHATAELER